MRYDLCRLFTVFCACAVLATTFGCREENDYWLKIKELLKKETPQEGNPELVKYLKSLTKEQKLIALRKYCKWVETLPPEKRGWPGIISMQIMMFYADPLKRSDLSNDEFERIKKRGDLDELEAGYLPGRLTDEAFEKLIAGITDQKEGDYFRAALAVLLGWDEFFFPALSKTQKKRYFDTCLAVLSDRESPASVRVECLRALWKVYDREYRYIIHKDEVVKKLMGTGSREEERKAKTLLYSGKINLTSKTIEQLSPWRKSIYDFRKKLVALLEDEREPESLKKEAKRHLYWLDRLPLITTKKEKLNSHQNPGT